MEQIKEIKTLEDFIRENGIQLTEGTLGWKQGLRGKVLEDSDFILRVKTENPLTFYIHPSGRNGSTLDAELKANTVIVTSYID